MIVFQNQINLTLNIKTQKWKMLRKRLFCSQFLLYYTGQVQQHFKVQYIIIEGLIAKIFEDHGMKNVGAFQWTIFYSTVLIGTFFYPYLNISFKRQAVSLSLLSFISYGINLLIFDQQIFGDLTYFLVGISAIVGGIANISMNILGGRYISYLCRGKDSDQKGQYFGIFLTINNLNGFLSAIISIFSQGLFGSQSFLLLLTCMTFFQALFAFFVVENDEDSQNLELMEANDRDDSFVSKFCLLFNYYPKMKNNVILILMDGLSVGILSVSLMHILPKQSSNLISTISLLLFGIGAFLSGYISGRLTDFIQYRFCGMIGILLFFICCVGSVVCIYVQQLWISQIMFFLWGFFIYYVEGYEMVICCKAFHEDVQSFTISRQLRSIGQLSYVLFMALTKSSIPLPYIMLSIATLCVPSFFLIRNWKPQNAYVQGFMEERDEQ